MINLSFLGLKKKLTSTKCTFVFWIYPCSLRGLRHRDASSGSRAKSPKSEVPLLASPSGLYPVGLCSLSGEDSSSAPCCFLAQPLSGSDLPGQLLPCFVFFFWFFCFVLFLFLHPWLAAKSCIPSSENRTWDLGLFLYRQCWVIWCPPEVDAGKCNYCLRFFFFNLLATSRNHLHTFLFDHC